MRFADARAATLTLDSGPPEMFVTVPSSTIVSCGWTAFGSKLASVIVTRFGALDGVGVGLGVALGVRAACATPVIARPPVARKTIVTAAPASRRQRPLALARCLQRPRDF